MIYVTRLNHTSIVLNSFLIEHIETTPDTVISLTTGEKLRVLESAEEIVSRVVEFQRSIQRFHAAAESQLPPRVNLSEQRNG